MIWNQNSVCTIIFLHLDCQVIIINEPFSNFFHSKPVCLNVRISLFFLYQVSLCSTFFCIRFLNYLGTCSRWRLTVLSTFIFPEFFHFWVWPFYYMLLQRKNNDVHDSTSLNGIYCIKIKLSSLKATL